MTNQDLRWKQSFKNFLKAFDLLKRFIDKGPLNEFEELGLIQCFEYNYELGWNVIKDFYESKGKTHIQGSRDAFQLVLKNGIIFDENLWMDMIKSRVLTSDTYRLSITKEIVKDITDKYFFAFSSLKKSFERNL